MAEKRLGRGLDYLLSRTAPAKAPVKEAEGAESPATAAASAPTTPTEVALDTIRANPHQPRTEFDPEALAELQASIEQHGVLQPVVLRRVGEVYEIVAGERRCRASRNLGRPTVPAVVREVSDDQMLALALVENIQRENLNPIETAKAYRELVDEAGLTQEELSKVVGKSRPTVANTLRLLDLPEDVQAHVSRGTLSAGHARALLGLDDEVAMRALGDRVVAEGLSVRETEALVKEGTPPAPAGESAPTTKRERSAHLDDLEDQLRRSLGVRVAVKPGRGKRGKVVLWYSSLEEFDRLYEILAGPADANPAERPDPWPEDNPPAV